MQRPCCILEWVVGRGGLGWGGVGMGVALGSVSLNEGAKHGFWEPNTSFIILCRAHVDKVLKQLFGATLTQYIICLPRPSWGRPPVERDITPQSQCPGTKSHNHTNITSTIGVWNIAILTHPDWVCREASPVHTSVEWRWMCSWRTSSHTSSARQWGHHDPNLWHAIWYLPLSHTCADGGTRTWIKPSELLHSHPFTACLGVNIRILIQQYNRHTIHSHRDVCLISIYGKVKWGLT